MGNVRLTIDGRPVVVEGGETVLEAARSAGIFIPTICDHKDLTPYGACRMCIVEIEGIRGFPTSCTTPAADGMVVKTQTEELVTLRRRILELMLSGHPNSCLVCEDRELCEQYRPRASKAGRTTRCGFCSNREECTLRHMALDAGPRDLELTTLYSAHNVERNDPFMDRDYNLCILCGRCTRICEKIHGKPAISIINRGRWARPGTAFHKSHVYSGCTFCGACIDICPTGTLTDRFARWYGEPDRSVRSACSICPEGCPLDIRVKDGQAVASVMTAFERESRLCALGRFAFVQLAASPGRLARPMVKEAGEQIGTDWDSAIAGAAERLKGYCGNLAILVNEACSREDRFLYEKLAKAMDAKMGYVPAGQGGDALYPASLMAEILDGKFKAAVLAGAFLEEDALARLEYIVVIDFLPSSASRAADVLFPVAVLPEVSGTYRNAEGLVRKLSAAVSPPGEARWEWTIVRDLGRALNFEGFDYEEVDAVTSEIKGDPALKPFCGNPRQSLDDLPALFRGHHIVDTVCALDAFGLPKSFEVSLPESDGGFDVTKAEEVIPNFRLVTLRAPHIARHARPGQFVMMMVKDTSERTPYTLVDWDAEAGTISLVIEEVGRSSREAAMLKPGHRVAHVSGPLGLPFPIEKKEGAVVLGGGCYGIGAIYPIARALKQAGNRVICVIEAASHYLLFMEKELESVSDELIVATKDGTRGTRGGVQHVFERLAGGGTAISMFVAVGCTFMMRVAAERTRSYGIPLYVALNPIMLDGTGMCGACRVSIDGVTRFACVDGPIFDGHAVDWDELFSRRGAYVREEIESMSQGVEGTEGHHKHAGGAGCACHGD
jgi:NAD(P)H-flavin reductase/ferredoxin